MRLPFPRLCLPTLGVITLAGCSSNSDTPVIAEASPVQPQGGGAKVLPTDYNAAHIQRSEGVPNGVETNTGLTVPRGFQVQLLADGLNVPRRLAIAPGGKANAYDIFVAESRSNRIRVLRVRNTKVTQQSIFTTDTDQPYGITFWKNWVYVGNTSSVVRFAYKTGALKAGGPAQFITQLTSGGYNQHWTRNLLTSLDGSSVFITVGSSCNTCEEEDKQRAAISVMKPDGKDRRLYATGLRNPVGLAWQPGTGQLWTAVNERDRLGDDVPPDYITHVVEGGFYGWPYAYRDIEGRLHADPNFGDKQPGKVRQTQPWSVPVQAHSAALGLAFYPLSGGNFPASYSGDAFVTYHGSWNRSVKTGYKVARVDFQNGKPVSVTDFVTGFRHGEPKGGRPVDIQVAPDGSLLFSDDGRGRIWRVSYSG
jgi:glucose/arabinose dehydrogenase